MKDIWERHGLRAGRAGFWSVLVAVLACGCTSLLPTKRTDGAAVKAVENISASHDLVVREFLGPLPPHPNPLGIARHRVLESRTVSSAGSDETASARSKISIPLGVSLGLAGLGLMVLWVALWLWRRSSKTVAAVYGAADAGFAQVVKVVRAKIEQSTDPVEQALLQSIKAEVEAERGKVLSQ